MGEMCAQVVWGGLGEGERPTAQGSNGSAPPPPTEIEKGRPKKREKNHKAGDLIDRLGFSR